MKKGQRNSLPTFLYRIEICGNDGQVRRHLAQATAATDECARRKIIHKTMADGGHVKSILATEDHSTYPGEAAKRVYTGKDC